MTQVIKDQEICLICLLNDNCQHNFDYECKGTENYFKVMKLKNDLKTYFIMSETLEEDLIELKERKGNLSEVLKSWKNWKDEI